jgi:hypothetical protein
MPWAAAAAVAGAVITSSAQKSAAKKASQAQTASAQAGIDEQRYQFDEIRKLLAPYVAAGQPALAQQQALLGLSGPEAERAAISGIEQAPGFQSMLRQGEEALLSRASATGGLRGGNIQAALAQFRPQLLAQEIENRYGRLAGLTTLGQQSAAGVGSAGMQTGGNIANLLATQGAARAGSALAQGQAYGNLGAAIPQAVSAYQAFNRPQTYNPDNQPQTYSPYDSSAEATSDYFASKGTLSF